MKRLIQLASISALALAASAFMPSVTQATEPVPITFAFYFDQVNDAAGVASGTFRAQGLFADQGTGAQVFRLTPPDEAGLQTVHGVKTLSGAAGDMVMKFQVQMEAPWAPPAPPVILLLPDYRLGLRLMHGTGTFTVISGTAGYADLHARGTTVVDLVLPIALDGTPIGAPVLVGTYTGQAHFDP